MVPKFMSRFFVVFISFSIFLLTVSCSLNSAQTTNGQPGSPNDPGTNPTDQPEPPTRGDFQLGGVERAFSAENNTTCILDRNQREAIITFNDADSSTGFSIRMSNMDLSQTTYEIRSNTNALQGTALFSLGGDRKKSVFKFNQPQRPGSPSTVSYCKITYQMTTTHMGASLQCQNLVNGLGQTATATARWLCKLQTENEWKWE